MPAVRTLATALLIVALCQCAGGPALKRVVEVREGSRTMVSLRQQTVVLTMVNRSALTGAQAAAACKADPNLKLVPDSDLQLLLDALAAQAFFDQARAAEDPEARSWLTVVVDGKKLVLSGRGPGGDFAYMQRFADCLTLFNNVYNANNSFSGSEMTTEEFKRTGAETNAEAARRRKNGKSNQP